MFRSRTAALVSVLSLLALPALAVAPAQARVTVPTEVTVDVETPVVYGEDVIIEGQVSYTDLEDGKEYGLGDATVTLERRYLDSAEWVEAGSDVTAGLWPVFEFEHVAVKGAEYRVTFAGDETYLPSSARVVVRVYRKVSARIVEPQPVVLFLKGKVDPSYAGEQVQLMRKKCAACAWKQIGSQAATKSSTYRFRLPLPRTGTHYFRVRVPADAAFLTSFSPVWEVFWVVS